MRGLCPVILFNIFCMNSVLGFQAANETTIQYENAHMNELEDSIIGFNLGNAVEYNNGTQRSSYSAWGYWSGCRGGHRTRRRHCLRRHVCGDSVRIEIARCKRSQSRRQSEKGTKNVFVIPQLRQLNSEDIQRRYRGFSGWSPWSSCSKRCITTRKRQCVRRLLCGKQVMRQSAYCFIEGSFCHSWIRTRMQKRKDPGYTQSTLGHLIATPSPVIHPEDHRASGPDPTCGKLGKFRGSPSARMRQRMREMIRIIGGRPSPPGKWPWQVAVLNRYKEAFCGGTLVSLRWVVTAAHCVRRRLYVRLGEHDLMLRNRGEVEMKVTEAVVHPRYDANTVVNDVAMLRLPFSARPDLGHGVACLPAPNQPLPAHTSCVILGWGKKRATDVHGTRVLHEAQVSTIQQGVCRRSYWQYAITDDMVCAGRGRRDSCAGDSGGPLLCRDRSYRYFLQGITSFGDGCGKRGKYGIYTRTSGYVTWMKGIMNNKYFD